MKFCGRSIKQPEGATADDKEFNLMQLSFIHEDCI
jgi:hypothetical protein